MKKFLLLFLSVISITNFIYAQCGSGQSELHYIIQSDNYPAEVSWDLKDASGNIILSDSPDTAMQLIHDSICVSNSACYKFTMHDSYGDGICCNYGQGYYILILDGDTIAQGGDYDHSEVTSFNCPPGSDCTSPFIASAGNSYVAPNANTWYSFTPDSTASYIITTCSVNTCNTVLWLYDHCQNLAWDNTNAATYSYSDNECGTQAELSVALQAGTTYYIRVGTSGTSCTGVINWSIGDPQAIYGCMDITSCNFNPLATIDTANSCIYPGDPDCPYAPDLTIVQPTIVSSMYIANIAADNCSVQEQCLNGYGDRRIIRFTTHIKNIGELDYFIGQPTVNNPQFTFGNCHGHAHYEGYAEYVLYDTAGQALPIGFKNGFCVLDLECSGGGTAQYGCGNMGITAGCGDIYSAGLSCQWIDITDVDTGTYTFVTRVNWDQTPDALGRVESDFSNNWAQVCIHIFYDGTGLKNFNIVNTCAPYVDCLGQIYGSAQQDCNGDCAGTAKMGDLNNNGIQQTNDAQQYCYTILDNTINPTSCNDLNADGDISVFDAALLSTCSLYGSNYPLAGGGTHNYCDFPTGIVNINDTVELSIGTINTTDNYVDIYITNPDNEVLAYEFNISGLDLQSVDDLVNNADYPIAPHYVASGNKVIGISYLDSSINKTNVPKPLCRIFYNSISDTVCIISITDIVNDHYEEVISKIGNGCKAVVYTGENEVSQENYLNIVPNPSNGIVTIDFRLPNKQASTLVITDAIGKIVYEKNYSATYTNTSNIDISFLPAGAYNVNLIGNKNQIRNTLVIVK
jgi:hypothetical protein